MSLGFLRASKKKSTRNRLALYPCMGFIKKREEQPTHWLFFKMNKTASGPVGLCRFARRAEVAASDGAFAAILTNGSVVTWGAGAKGADSRQVQHQLKQVRHFSPRWKIGGGGIWGIWGAGSFFFVFVPFCYGIHAQQMKPWLKPLIDICMGIIRVS